MVTNEISDYVCGNICKLFVIIRTYASLLKYFSSKIFSEHI
jgi:hypothetical protein